jgi:hypothetical protein
VPSSHVLVRRDRLQGLLSSMTEIQRGYHQRKKRDAYHRQTKLSKLAHWLKTVESFQVKGACDCGRNHAALILNGKPRKKVCPVTFYAKLMQLILCPHIESKRWIQWKEDHPILSLLHPIDTEKDVTYEEEKNVQG